MKIIVLIALLVSSTAMATTYECNMLVKMDGKEIGTIQTIKDGVGFIMGTLATTKINEKKNIFGTVTRWDELQLIGTLQNAGELDTTLSDIKNALVGTVSISSHSRRQGQTASQDIASVSGNDNFSINSDDKQYSVSGNCAVKP